MRGEHEREVNELMAGWCEVQAEQDRKLREAGIVQDYEDFQILEGKLTGLILLVGLLIGIGLTLVVDAGAVEWIRGMLK